MITTIGVDRDQFYLGSPSRCSIRSSSGIPSDKGVIEPVLVFSAADCIISASGVLSCLESFPARDDDFHAGFISETIVLHLRAGQIVDPDDLRRGLKFAQSGPEPHWVPSNIYFVDATSTEVLIPSGPYFLLGVHIYEVYKLHEDPLQAFHTTVVPDSLYRDKYSILDGTSKDGISKVVAVPSRLYSTPTREKPLAGMRVAIKDNYALAGIKTSLQCLSFQETYSTEAETAEYVKMLTDLGAVIVGKTKLTAFASSEKPCDWVDFQCPFNPRADGYQSAGGSTTGGAAAIAGYPWLDYSIGSDTFGSVREPAAQNGVFGIRCTTDIAAPTKGLYPSCPYFDTVGFLGRDIETFKSFAIHTLSSRLANISQYPRRILYPTDYFPYKNAAQQRMAEDFIAMLENFLGVKRIELSLADLWENKPPPEAKKKSLAEFIHTSGYNPFYYDGYHEFDAFRADHQRLFNKKVYVSPHMQYKWDLGLEVSLEDRNKSITELEIFQRWFKENVLAPDNETISTAIMIIPVGPGQPVYRDVVVPFVKRYGIDPLNLASLLRIPQLVVPIGQSPYESRVTGCTEHLPIACSIAGASGSDLMLINLIYDALTTQGWPTEVKTGRYAFRLGNNIRNIWESSTPNTSFGG